MAISPLLYHYKLSIEELVLVLYTINCGKTAKALLARAYDEIPEEHNSILLTAGRNSLLAREFARLGENDLPLVPRELQQTVFPLSCFTTLVELYDEREDGGFYLQLFHHPQHGFTLQQNQHHVVFNLTYSADPKNLGSLLADLFDHVGGEESGDPLEEQTLNFSFEELQGWMGGDAGEIKAALEGKSFPDEQAERLTADLASVVGYGSISVSPVDFDAYIETDTYPVSRMIVYVEGAENTWLFEYGEEMDKPSLARRISLPDFHDFLTAIEV